MVHDIERRLLEGLDVQNVPVLSHSLFDGQPAHSNSIFKDCVLTDTELNCCLISKATITNTVLEGCILVNCDVLDCVLKDSHLKSSKIVESEFINSLRSKCEVRPTPYFNRIPPEVRVMIMSNAIRWNGKTPALLAAVRGDPVLYREALSTLPKVATFQLHQANEVNRKVMSQLAFQSIEKLEINGWEFNTKAFPRRLSFSTNIKEIHVDFTMQYSHNLPIERFDDVGRVWLRRLKCVQKLSLALLAPKGDPASFVRRAVDVANSNLGIQGKKEVRTRTRYVVPGCVDIEWTWEAKEGEALAWTVCQTERRCLAGKMMLQTGRR